MSNLASVSACFCGKIGERRAFKSEDLMLFLVYSGNVEICLLGGVASEDQVKVVSAKSVAICEEKEKYAIAIRRPLLMARSKDLFSRTVI